MPYAETFTVNELTVTGEDDDGNDIYTPVPRDVRGAFAPGVSSEQVQGAAQVVTHDTLYLDEGELAPGPQDTVLVRGVVREVDGAPAEYANPFTGWRPGAVVQLKVVTG